MSCGTQDGTARLYRGVVDRASHRRVDPVWLEEAWHRSRVVVVDRDESLVTGDPLRLVFLRPDDAPSGDRLFLGMSYDDVPCFAVDAPLPTLPDAVPASLRIVGHQLSDVDTDVFTTAVALANWQRDAQFDPRTGEPTGVGEGGWVRTSLSGAGRTQWPRTDPAMIVLVHDGVPGPEGRCLLAHKPEWPTNRYSCLAGYVEPGESVEATVEREVGEEVGVRVSDIRYVTSQPWPFPRSLMLAYTALADPEDPVVVDGVEIEQAHWFRRADFDGPDGPKLPFQTSVAYFLITSWLHA
ncbi:MAG: NAD(+) diphosphatase [Actinocatenispora sp.]